MREYEVYLAWGTVRIKAERMNVYYILDKPLKIYFVKDGRTVAEFYLDNIAGWSERTE